MNEINNTSKSNKSRKSHKSNQSNKTNQTNHQSSDKPNIHPAKQTAAICCHWFLCSAPPPGCVSESPAHLHAETHLKTRTFGPWSHELLSPNPNGTRGQTPSGLDKHAADQQKCWGGAGEMGIPANFGGFASPTQWEFKSTRWKNYSTNCVTFWTTISRPLITSKHDGSARALFTVLHSCYTVFWIWQYYAVLSWLKLLPKKNVLEKQISYQLGNSAPKYIVNQQRTI